MTDYPTIKLSEITIEDRLREVDPNWVEALAKMIETSGLLQPIVIWKDEDKNRLVAGLHRVEAYKLLEQSEIPYRLSDATSRDEARTDEIIENIARNELTVFDRAHNLFELKAVYERLHPETKAGVAGGKARQGSATDILSFADDTAEKIGLSERHIRRSIKLWKGLTGDSKQRLQGTWLADHQANLRLLSEHKPPVQKKVLDILFEEKATSVTDALLLIERGRLPTHVEKRYGFLNTTIRRMKDEEFDILMAAHPKKVEAWLKRTGRA